VVTASVGMHLRQKHPPHMSILEKRGLMSVPCFSHEKNPLPCFSPILCLATTLCKAYYRASATLRRTSAVPPPHVASRNMSHGYLADVAEGPTRWSARKISRGAGAIYCRSLSSTSQPPNGGLAATSTKNKTRNKARGTEQKRRFWYKDERGYHSVPPIDNRKRVPPPPVTIPRTRPSTPESIFPANLPSPLVISET
jgi:hypothetical protein